MAEATQGSPENTGGAPAEAPALSAELVSEIVTKAIDARMPGFMSTVDKRISGLQQEVQRAQMSPDEIDREEEANARAEVEALKRQNAILSAAPEFPEATKAYLELQSKKDGKEQLAYLQALINPAPAPEAAPDEGGEPADDTAPVESNRAPSTPPDGAQEAADDSILGQFTSWPGSDFFRRG